MSYQEFDAQEEIKSIWVHIGRLTNEIKILANKLSNQLEAQVKPATCEHNFQIARNGYFKSTGEIGTLGLPTYKQDIVYCMLYCTKCGETKEIITS